MELTREQSRMLEGKQGRATRKAMEAAGYREVNAKPGREHVLERGYERRAHALPGGPGR